MADTPAPTYQDLIKLAGEVFNTGAVASAEDAAALKAEIDKLLAPGRGSTLDFSDPANAGLMTVL